MTLRNDFPAIESKPVAEEKTARELVLEAVEDETALAWVEGQNKKTKTKFGASRQFHALEKQFLDAYEDKRKLPVVAMNHGRLYNHWQDDVNVQGLWRRTTVVEFKKETPAWDVLLDIDNLPDMDTWMTLSGEEKSEDHWVFEGAPKSPDGRRALVQLSLGGKDAFVMREFDLEQKTYMPNGFALPAAKSALAYHDNDSMWVATDLGEGSLTESGYPRIVKLWQRGQPLADARTIFTGEFADMEVNANTWNRPEASYPCVTRSISFYNTEYFLMNADLTLTKLPLPIDAELKGFFNGQVLFVVRKEWKIASGQTFREGSVLALSLDSIGNPDDLRVSTLFVPTDTCFQSDVSTTRSHVWLTLQNNVCTEIHRYTPNCGSWIAKKLPMPELGDVTVDSAEDDADELIVSFVNFQTPQTYYHVANDGAITALKSAPAYFDGDLMVTKQWFAVSQDGTRVPYFITHRKDLQADGTNPTFLYGYGGFEISIAPYYFGIKGKAWLEAGGVYVNANIRGGGEFGPRWHQAALKENRPRAFEDFIAVAEDLIAKKITSPQHLGIKGASNGGLLVGAVAMMRPDLFNAVVCECPLLDMLNYHKYSTGISWASEYGNPDEPGMYDAMRRYSPYQNIRADVTYPEIIFKTSTKDDRVHPAHARKMADKMQAMGHTVYYYENTEGGHQGVSNLKQQAFAEALNYSYLMQKLMRPQAALVQQMETSVHGMFTRSRKRKLEQEAKVEVMEDVPMNGLGMK